MGVVALAIIGMLYKIIPFLVWFGVYSKHIGRAQVPALADMYSPRLQMIGYWSFLVAPGCNQRRHSVRKRNSGSIGALCFTTRIALLRLTQAKFLHMRSGHESRHWSPIVPKPISMNPPALLNEQIVLDALRQVIDPEIGCNIVDLGLVYGTAITGAKVTVQMTLTTPVVPWAKALPKASSGPCSALRRSRMRQWRSSGTRRGIPR